jgi:hypothetical protein
MSSSHLKFLRFSRDTTLSTFHNNNLAARFQPHEGSTSQSLGQIQKPQNDQHSHSLSFPSSPSPWPNTRTPSQVWNGHLGRDHDERIDFDGVGGDEFGYENKEVSQILTTWIPSKLYDQHYP